MGKSIADNWVLSNTHFDKDVLMAAIMIKGGTFEPLYTDPLYFREMSTFWWLKWSRPFNDWFDALDLTYNPIEDYEKNDVIHEDTTDTGAEGTVSTSTEVVDQDDTSRLSSATHDVVDRDTTDSETTSGREVTDEDGTSSKSGTIKEVTDDDVTYSKSGTSKEITDDDSTSKKTGSDTNAVVGTKTSAQTTNTVEQLSGKDMVDHDYNKDIDTVNKVTAFDSNIYQPHDTSHTDDVLNSENTDTTYGKKTTIDTTTSGTDTDNTTTTTTYNTTINETDDKTVTNTYSESGTGTDDKTVNTTTSESGTTSNDSTVTTSGSKSGTGTEDITKDQTYNENGSKTKDVTTTFNGSVDKDKTNDRDFDRTLRSTGLVGFLHTRQGLLKEQLDIRAWNAYEHIADIFVKEMTIRVY